jgi:hypothetical protein
MRNAYSLLRATAACIGLAIPTMLLGQQLAVNTALPSAPAASLAVAPVELRSPARTPAKTPAWGTTFDRWVDLNTLTYSARYRSTFDANGARGFDQGS